MKQRQQPSPNNHLFKDSPLERALKVVLEDVRKETTRPIDCLHEMITEVSTIDRLERAIEELGFVLQTVVAIEEGVSPRDILATVVDMAGAIDEEIVRLCDAGEITEQTANRLMDTLDAHGLTTD